MTPDHTIESILARVAEIVRDDTERALSDRALADIRLVLMGALAPPQPAATLQAREATLLMADLRGFTALAATQAAGRVVGMLNRCLERLSALVVRHGGHVGRVAGDSLLVSFGAQGDRDNAVVAAVTCAVEMQIAMRDLNLEFALQRLPAVYLGIGINTGKVMAGAVGSGDQAAFALLGDGVQLASRIESFCLQGQVLISESTYAQCKTLVSATAPVPVAVKGQAEPVLLREVVAIPSRRLKVPRQDYRRSHRADVRLTCEARVVRAGVTGQTLLAAHVLDLGYHGVQVEFDTPVSMGDEVSLDFDLPLVDYHASQVRGRVVGLKRVGDRTVAGVEFLGLEPETQQRLQAYVQMLVTSA